MKLRRNQLTIFGGNYDTPDRICQRDYLHIVDLAAGHLRALKYAAVHSGVSVLELVNTFQKVNGITLPYIVGPRRSGDLPAFWADARKVKELLHWEAAHAPEDMCKSAWHFARNCSR